MPSCGGKQNHISVVQATLIGERITGRGVVSAVDHAVGVPLWEIEPLLGALVIALIVGAVYPRRRFANRQAQVRASPLLVSLCIVECCDRRCTTSGGLLYAGADTQPVPDLVSATVASHCAGWSLEHR